MSWNSSELLSEDSQSEQEGSGPSSSTKQSFSFQRYLDEVAGDSEESSKSEDDLSKSEIMGGDNFLSYDKSEEGDKEEEGSDGAPDAPVDVTTLASGSRLTDTVADEVGGVQIEDKDLEIEPDTSEMETDGNEETVVELKPMTEDLAEMQHDRVNAEEQPVATQLEDMVPAMEMELTEKVEEVESAGRKEKKDEAEVQSMKGISPGNVQSPPHLRSALPTFPRTPQRTPTAATTSILSPSKNLLASPPPSVKRVRMSPLTKTMPSKRPMKTPPRKSQQVLSMSPTQSQSKSKRPKIISPFSPRARKMRLQSQGHKQSASKVQWSMAPSRKVSILVNVSPHLDAPISSNDEENTLCLYPNVVAEDSNGISGTTVSILNSPARSIKSSYSVTSEMSILNKAGPGQEVILVNPTAFDEVIPTSVTVETARVVQQFSNIVSEDWVRKYRFDEVCWPDVKQLIGIKKQTTNGTMEDISKAAVADILNGENAVLFGYGVLNSGRMESMFGSLSGSGIDPLNTLSGRKSIGLELGLFGLSISMLLDQQARDKSEMSFKITMVEILQENVLRDLLLDPKDGSKETDTNLKMRHPDTKGAIVENATEITIGSIGDLKNVVRRAFHSRFNLKARNMVGGRGHIIASIQVFSNGENTAQKDYSYSLLQLVDLACAQTEHVDQTNVPGRSNLDKQKVQNRRVACIRKSMAALGALLRGQVVQEARHLTRTSLYRSCTLTKLLQRAMNNEKSRTVMISTVCPRRDSYESTLHTLNFMHKLLVRPGKTAESPFETRTNEELEGQSIGGFFSPGDHSIANSVAHSVASSVASEAIRSEFAHVRGNRAFMKSLVTDPRQRLATLLSPKDISSGTGSYGGVPMQEITTIKEVVSKDMDEVDHYDSKLEDLNSSQEEANQSEIESLESSMVDDSIDKSQSRVSMLSDEISEDPINDDDSPETSEELSEGTDSNDRNGTFDQVLDQLDEIDAFNEGESEYLVSADESSVESLQPLDMSNMSNVEPQMRREDPPDTDQISISEDAMEDASEENEDVGNTSVSSVASPPVEPRPDPVGITADEITIQSPNRTRSVRPQQAFNTDSNNGEIDSNEDVIEYSDFAHSMISTLTMTRASSEESYSAGSSEESFPRPSSPDHDLSEESYPREDVDNDESFGEDDSNELLPDDSQGVGISYSSNDEEEETRHSRTRNSNQEPNIRHPNDASRQNSDNQGIVPSTYDNTSSRGDQFFSTDSDRVVRQSRPSQSFFHGPEGEDFRGKEPGAFLEEDIYENRVVPRFLPVHRSNDVNRSPNAVPRPASQMLSDYEFDGGGDSHDTAQFLSEAHRQEQAFVANSPRRNVSTGNPSIPAQIQGTRGLPRVNPIATISASSGMPLGENVHVPGTSMTSPDRQRGDLPENSGMEMPSQSPVYQNRANPNPLSSTSLSSGMPLGENVHVPGTSMTSPDRQRGDLPEDSGMEMPGHRASPGLDTRFRSLRSDQDPSVTAHRQGMDVELVDSTNELTSHQNVSVLDGASIPLRDHDTNIDVSPSPIEAHGNTNEKEINLLKDTNHSSLEESGIYTKNESSESPGHRRVEKSVIKKVRSLVQESKALRAYSPDKNSRESLHNYKKMLEESLNDLDGEMEESSSGLSLDPSDNEFGDENTTSIRIVKDLAYPASDGSSSEDGNSLEFDETPNDDFLQNTEMPMEDMGHMQLNETNAYPGSLENELKTLQESLKRCVESTNESEVITELAGDKLDLAQSFKPSGNPGRFEDQNPLVRTVQVLTYQTDALQTFIQTTLNQLKDARGAERDGQLELLDVNSRLEETLEEVQNLKSSNDRSLDQMRRANLENISALQRETKRERELNESFKSEEEDRLKSALSAAEKERDLLEQNILSLNKDTSELKEQLEKTNEERKKDNETHAKELSSLVEALNRNDANQGQRAEIHRTKVQELETRLIEQKELRRKAEDELRIKVISFSEETDRHMKEKLANSSLRDELLDLQSRLADEAMSKQSSIARLEKELVEKTRVNDKQSDEINSMKSALEERLASEKSAKEKETLLRERLTLEEKEKDELEDRLTDELNSLQASLRAKSEQNDELLKTLKSVNKDFEEHLLDKDNSQARLSEKVASLTEALEKQNDKCINLEHRLKTLQSDHEEQLCSEQEEKTSFQETIARLETELRKVTELSDGLQKDARDKISSLQREINDKEGLSSNLATELEVVKNEYEELMNTKTTIESTFKEKIIVLEQLAAEEASSKNQTEADLREKLSLLEKDIENKADDMMKLQESSNAAQNAFEKRLKMECIEKASLEDEIATLQERLREEAQDKDDIEARLARNSSILQNQIDIKSRSEQELQDSLNTLRSNHDAMTKQHDSQVEKNKLLEEEIEGLEQRAADEHSRNEELQTRLSQQHTAHSEALERCRYAINDLSERLQISEDACADAESRVETKSNEITSMKGKLSQMIDDHVEEIKVKEEEERKLKERLNEMKELFEEISSANDQLSHDVENLERERNTLQNQLDENMEEKFAHSAEVTKLKSELDKQNETKEIFQNQISSLKKDNAGLKNKIVTTVEELTTGLQLMEREKASFESANLELERALDSKTQQIELLLEEVAQQKETLSELEHRLRSEIEEYELEKEELLVKTEFLESSLNDCGKSKEDLNKSIRALEEENEALNRNRTDQEKMLEDATKNIVKLESFLADKTEEADQMQSTLSQYKKEISSLNKVLSDMSKENSEATRIHTEKIITLTHTIREKEETVVDQSEDIAKLQDQIEGLKEAVRNEKESKIKSEQSHIAQILKLKEILSRKETDINALSAHSNDQKSEIATMSKKLSTEIETKNKIISEKSDLRNTIERLRVDNDRLQDKLEGLDDEVSRLNKLTEVEINQKENVLSELMDLKSTFKKEKDVLQDSLLSKSEETHNLFEKIQDLETVLSVKDRTIEDLEQSVVQLTSTLEAEISKVQTLSFSKNTAEEENMKISKERDSLLQRFTEEMGSKSTEIDKLRQSLQSKSTKNKKLKEELASARNEKDTFEKDAEEALEESRAANTDLLNTLTRTKEDLKARIRELEKEKHEHDNVTDQKLESLSERISDLSIVRETLQNENTLLMRKIEEQEKSYVNLEKKNKLLRTAMSDNEKQLRDQMNELESTMHLTISKIESKRKKTVVEERSKYKATVERLEDESDGYKVKIAQLEGTIRQLERKVANSASENIDHPQHDEFRRLREENERLRSRIETHEHSESSHRFSERRQQTPTRNSSPYRTQSDDGSNYYSNIYKSERDRRLKAEEFAAAMAARAKAGFEKKNEEIVGLKMQINTLEAEKENVENQQQLRLRNGGSIGHSETLSLAIQERDEAIEEARKYRSIANKLNQQVITMGRQIELFDDENHALQNDDSIGNEDMNNFGV